MQAKQLENPIGGLCQNEVVKWKLNGRGHENLWGNVFVEI